MSVWTENIIAEFHQKILSGCLKIWKIRQGITFFCRTLIWLQILEIPQIWSVVVFRQVVMWSWLVASCLHYDTWQSSQKSVFAGFLRSCSVRWVPRQPPPRCEYFYKPPPPIASRLFASCPVASPSGCSLCPPSQQVRLAGSLAWTWRRCAGCETRYVTEVCRVTLNSPSVSAAGKRHSACYIRRLELLYRRHQLSRCCPVWRHVSVCNNQQTDR